MAKYRISVNALACIGCGACEASCSEYFELQGGKSTPKKPEVDELGCARDAATNCPVSAIKIIEL